MVVNTTLSNRDFLSEKIKNQFSNSILKKRVFLFFKIFKEIKRL